jgi:GT2 family glycosyltransferase
MSSPRVFAVIINWNGEKDTILCLDSLRKVQYDELHVVISDNGSHPESLGAIREWVKNNPCKADGYGPGSYTILENGRNLGFTGANTTGIEVALKLDADYVLFLNNDTIVHPDFLKKMVAAGESDPQFGIVGCKILSARAAGQDLERIWSLGGYAWHTGVPINIANGKADRPEWKGLLANDLINGCCMLIKRAVIDQIGVQDDALFFGMDDVEYSLRARKQGWRNVIVLDAEIHHIGSHSVSAGSPLQAYYLFRNMPFLRATYFPWYRNVGFALIYAIRYVLMGGAARILTGRTNVNKAMMHGIHDFFSKRMGECRHPSLVNR